MEDYSELIALMQLIQEYAKSHPNTEIVFETDKGCLHATMNDCLIFVGVGGKLVFDAE